MSATYNIFSADDIVWARGLGSGETAYKKNDLLIKSKGHNYRMSNSPLSGNWPPSVDYLKKQHQGATKASFVQNYRKYNKDELGDLAIEDPEQDVNDPYVWLKDKFATIKQLEEDEDDEDLGKVKRNWAEISRFLLSAAKDEKGTETFAKTPFTDSKDNLAVGTQKKGRMFVEFSSSGNQSARPRCCFAVHLRGSTDPMLYGQCPLSGVQVTETKIMQGEDTNGVILSCPIHNTRENKERELWLNWNSVDYGPGNEYMKELNVRVRTKEEALRRKWDELRRQQPKLPDLSSLLAPPENARVAEFG